MIYELIPKYDTRKSFYGKAKIINVGSEEKLYSYDTLVADYDRDSNTILVYGTHSNTTLRHIKEFLKQKGFKADTKAQIEKDYMI
jgi:hypothetical protein